MVLKAEIIRYPLANFKEADLVLVLIYAIYILSRSTLRVDSVSELDFVSQRYLQKTTKANPYHHRTRNARLGVGLSGLLTWG